MSSAHGWSDDEARPMPYGELLANLTSTPIPVSPGVTFQPTPPGSWRTVGVRISTGGVPVKVTAQWGWTNASAPGPASVLVHPGDGSLVLMATRGHTMPTFTFEAESAVTGDVLLVGSNLDPDAGAVTRFLRVANPAAGVSTVPIYTAPAGVEATVLELAFLLFLPARACSPLGSVNFGIDLQIKDAGGTVYYVFGLIQDSPPATYAPPPNDPDRLIAFVTNPTLGNFSVFGVSDEGLIPWASGAGGVAYYSTQGIAIGSLILPPGHTLQLLEWGNPGGFGLFQHNPAADPKLNISRTAPNAGDQFSGITVKVQERPVG